MALTLVTGSTGLVGFHILSTLLHDGRKVRALLRNPSRARGILPPEVDLVEGDVTQPETLARAMEGCDIVHHAAGLPEQWVLDPGIFEKVNAEGTRNMVEAAKRAGVQKFVYTSTIDVFEAATGQPYDESQLAQSPKNTWYERSKQQADRIVVDAQADNFHVVFTHPSGVYGPGPSTSRTLTQTILDLARGKMPALLPGMVPVVFAPDVGLGHLLAERKGAPGSRFILHDSTLTLNEIALLVATELGHTRTPPVLPTFAGRALSVLGEGLARWTKRPPLVPEGQFHFLQWSARPVSLHAQRTLGWIPTPFPAGLRATLTDFKHTGAL